MPEYRATQPEINKARSAVEGLFLQRDGSPLVVSSLREVLSMSRGSRKGMSADAVGFVLDGMRYDGLLKAKTYPEGNDELHISPGSARYWLTGRGRKHLGLKEAS